MSSDRTPLFGYADARYAASLAEFGEPLSLPRCGGWILGRAIGGTPRRDAIGCYPLFACSDWNGLDDDLAGQEGRLVSVTLVTDPFGDYTPELLTRCFPERMARFKEHFVVEFGSDWRSAIAEHHRRNIRKARSAVEVEWTPDASVWTEDWIRLYDVLVRRHDIRGMAAFSRACFEQQLRVKGMEACRAIAGGETIGMLLWLVSEESASANRILASRTGNGRHGGRPSMPETQRLRERWRVGLRPDRDQEATVRMAENAYYHLGAYSEKGYTLRASYALFAEALERYAARGLRRLGLGAGAGAGGDGTDGLTRFKRGWANATRPVYLCGRVLDRVRYEELSAAAGVEDTLYFPAYRSGEFR